MRSQNADNPTKPTQQTPTLPPPASSSSSPASTRSFRCGQNEGVKVLNWKKHDIVNGTTTAVRHPPTLLAGGWSIEMRAGLFSASTHKMDNSSRDMTSRETLTLFICNRMQGIYKGMWYSSSTTTTHGVVSLGALSLCLVGGVEIWIMKQSFYQHPVPSDLSIQFNPIRWGFGSFAIQQNWIFPTCSCIVFSM